MAKGNGGVKKMMMPKAKAGGKGAKVAENRGGGKVPKSAGAAHAGKGKS